MIRGKIENIFLLFLFALPFWALLSAKIIAFIMPVLGIAGAYIFFSAPEKKLPRWLWGIYILLLLFWFSCKWTIMPLPDYLNDMLPTSLLLVAGCFAVLGASHTKLEPAHLLVLPVTWLLLAAFLLFEKYTGHSLRKLFYGLLEKEMRSDLVSVLNKQTCILAFLLLPSLLAAWQGGWLWLKRLFPALAIAAITALLYKSASQIAQVALAVTLLFLLFPTRLKLAWGGLVLGIGAAILLMPWWLALLHDFLMPYAVVPSSFLGQASAAARLEIWDALARYLMQSPFTGFGVDATRHIQDLNIQGQFYKGETVVHPHNFTLQLWFEFGVAGALWGSIFVIYLVRRIQKAEITRGARKLLLASSMGVLVAAFTGWGLWQGWWIGFLFLYAAIWQSLLARAPSNAPATA
ncbi:MAG: hypothetical protein GC136_08190 [Alphaproteobacteria bacterium]|nr:hypothetical protein [Alphaproteobacteria bacterium]